MEKNDTVVTEENNEQIFEPSGKMAEEGSLTAELLICVGDQEMITMPMDKDLMIGSGSAAEVYHIDSRYVGTLHGKFIKTLKGYKYIDLGTPYGTYLNSRESRMKPADPVKLADGDVLRIQGDAETNPEETVTFVFRKRYTPNEKWKSLDLKDGSSRVYISRYEEKEGEDEAFVAGEAIPELPRHHAMLTYEENQWFVVDESTMYGVYLNNRKINEKSILQENDVIRIGNTIFIFRTGKLWYSHRESSENKLVIHIEERNVWNLFRKKILLRDVNLSVHPGEMVLVLGGSGAGKTTFMNAVMGYEKAKGSIKHGKQDVYEDFNQMKYRIGFVPQADLLRGDDTVYATLKNAAQLKLPVNLDRKTREECIQNTLVTFGLEQEKKNLVRKLSGGQRKRLSVAVEFIASPNLFFLDEPDSGLDGVMARELMRNLREIADQQKIVMVISHAPDRTSYLFDKVLVLAKSEKDKVGHLAFYGLVDEAKEFFGTEKLEEIVKKINRKNEGGEGLADYYIERYAELEKKTGGN